MIYGINSCFSHCHSYLFIARERMCACMWVRMLLVSRPNGSCPTVITRTVEMQSLFTLFFLKGTCLTLYEHNSALHYAIINVKSRCSENFEKGFSKSFTLFTYSDRIPIKTSLFSFFCTANATKTNHKLNQIILFIQMLIHWFRMSWEVVVNHLCVFDILLHWFL